MRTSLLALTAIAAFAAFNTTPAEARNRAVCLFGAQTYGVRDCSYDTMAQCRASASGTGSYCEVNSEYLARGYNPNDAYADAPPPRRRARYYSGY